MDKFHVPRPLIRHCALNSEVWSVFEKPNVLSLMIAVYDIPNDQDQVIGSLTYGDSIFISNPLTSTLLPRIAADVYLDVSRGVSFDFSCVPSLTCNWGHRGHRPVRPITSSVTCWTLLGRGWCRGRPSRSIWKEVGGRNIGHLCAGYSGLLQANQSNILWKRSIIRTQSLSAGLFIGWCCMAENNIWQGN